MSTLTKASDQWKSRAADERFSNVTDLHNAAVETRQLAAHANVPVRELKAKVIDGRVVLNGRTDTCAELTNWSFGQLAGKADAPASYLSRLPATLAAEALNHGLAQAGPDQGQLLFQRDRAESGMMTLRAITSDRYSRIWNADVTERLLELETRGPWQPTPAAFDGSRGLYLGDRDMFAFMVDSDRRIFEKLPGGGLSRGFFAWNSEVGAATFGISTFMYQYVCGNHMVWGASNVRELKVRHIGNAAGRGFSGLIGELKAYAESSEDGDVAKVEAMQRMSLGNNPNEVLDAIFGLKNRPAELTKKVILESYEVAEKHTDWYGDPRTVWGMVSGMTQVARDMPNANDRAALERASVKVMALAG